MLRPGHDRTDWRPRSGSGCSRCCTKSAASSRCGLMPDALTAQNRVFVEEIARWQKEKAAALGVDGGQTGAAHLRAALQRDARVLRVPARRRARGVFTKAEDGAVAFREGPAPSREEIAAVAAR